MIEAHHVPPRWEIPASVTERGGPSADYAAKRAIERAHAEIGVPPMRCLTNVSTAHVTVTSIERDVPGFNGPSRAT